MSVPTSVYLKLRQFQQFVTTLGEKFVKYCVVGTESKCLQCHYEINSPHPGFCSQKCEIDYYEEFKRAYKSEYGEVPLCSFPDCMKSCYVENHGHTHDYCSRSHAQEHQMMKEEIERQSRAAAAKKNDHPWGRGRTCGRGRGTRQQHDGNKHQQNTGPAYNTRSVYSYRDPNGPIYFYNRDEPYYEFTNFYIGAKIELDGVSWRTTEHYFQAQKFVGTPFVDKIRNSFTPRDAFSLSRDPVISYWRRSDWEEVKMNVMRKALFAKFTQNLFLKRKLVETGNRILVERSPYDSFWGDGGDGTGQNHLGNLLMELRAKLQGEDDIEMDGVQEFGENTNSEDKCAAATGSQSGRSNEADEANRVAVPSEQLQRRPLNNKSSLIDSDDTSQSNDSNPVLQPNSVMNTSRESENSQENEDEQMEKMDTTV